MARKTVQESTPEEAFALADEVARDIVANRALVAERDQHIQDVQDKYNPLIEANDKAIDAKIALVAMFAKSHRAEYFADKKSCETPLAILSFRYGNPTLKPLSSKDSWDEIAAALEAAKDGKEFVKVKKDIDKRGLLKKTAEWLAGFKLRITQSETFAIDPKTDAIA